MGHFNTDFKQGFSLLEVIMAIFVFSLIIVALSLFILKSYRANYFIFEQIAAIEEARKGIETMVKEIREAREGEDGSYPIIQAGDSQFIFYSDINKDASVERVRYFLDGTTLKKGVVEPSGDPLQYVLSNEVVTALSAYIRNDAFPVFTYYNGDWPGDTVNNPLPTLTRLTDTKLMHVYLKVNVDPNRPPNDFELESDSQVRNLKTNL